VANPTWTIPKSIQRSELAHVSSAYLAEHNMVRRGGWIVQQSGRGNALGLIKFDMLNHQAIYLHDTSARSLFGRSQRHLSHGCVRVDDAAGFAELIARDERVTERWSSAQASGKQTFVALPHKIPVRLLYHNVFQADDGAIAFRTDPYGWNAPIGVALGFNGNSAKNAVAQNVDVGP
jgi:murein L,D-transpeptidase YcbB/YkuD